MVLISSIFLKSLAKPEKFQEMIKRGDKHPLIAKRTSSDYQKCLTLKKEKKETEAVLMTEGIKVLLSCPLCLPPEESAESIWWQYPNEVATAGPVPLDGRRVRILSDLSLEMTNAWIKDSGVYICQKGENVFAKYAIDIVEAEPHRYVIMSGKKKNVPSVDYPLKDLNLIIGTTWSEWSQCNRCGSVGRRRRIGICTVRKFNPNEPSKPVDSLMLNEYKKGIPCRSKLLPQEIRDLSIIASTESEFAIGFCKIPCPPSAGIVVITDASGKVVDTVDNSQGVYSMQQPLPDLPSLAKRRTLYEAVDKSILMACPGNTEGKFLIWRNDSFIINPSKVHIITKGRVKIDLANNLLIRKLRYTDTAVYSCWDDKRLIGTVRLQVTDKSSTQSVRIYILNIGIIFTFLTIIMIAVTVCKNARLQTKE